MIPNSATILRMEKAGFVEHLMRAANNGARVRAICPITPSNENVIKKLSESPNITILNGEPMTSGFFVLDNKKYFRADTRNPEAENMSEALGFLEYSNSKSRIESYKTFFEIIWKQLQSYRALQEHNRTQNEFISMAAHELKNPIQPILGLAQVLSDKATQQDKHLLDIIVRNAKKLADMQDNILDVTRIDSNNLRLRKENVNIKNIINDVVLSYKNQPGVELKVDVADAFANVDIDRISQVLSNLLSNAIKYTSDAIMIKLAKDHDSLIVTVQDNGVGIELENLAKVFTKFFTTSEKGTGLGLFISKSIVEAHGGKIWAQKNHGKGAIFGFSLPLE